MSVDVEQAKTAVDDAAAVVDRLAGLPLGYTDREILAAVRGVLTALDAALAVVAAHEHAQPAAPVDTVTQVTIAPPASAPDGGPAA